jgi:hypothetical protein
VSSSSIGHTRHDGYGWDGNFLQAAGLDVHIVQAPSGDRFGHCPPLREKSSTQYVLSCFNHLMVLLSFWSLSFSWVVRNR